MSFGWFDTFLLAVATMGWTVAAGYSEHRSTDDAVLTVLVVVVLWILLVAAIVANIVNPLHLLRAP